MLMLTVIKLTLVAKDATSDRFGRLSLGTLSNLTQIHDLLILLDFLVEWSGSGIRLSLHQPLDTLDLIWKQRYAGQDTWHCNVWKVLVLLLQRVVKHLVQRSLLSIPV